MTSILLLAIGVGIATAFLGSVIFQILIPDNDLLLSPLEKKCQEIANGGYKIHTFYPNSDPEDLFDDDRKRLLYLDNLWIKECVSVLPADSIFSIVNNVERNFSYNE